MAAIGYHTTSAADWIASARPERNASGQGSLWKNSIKQKLLTVGSAGLPRHLEGAHGYSRFGETLRFLLLQKIHNSHARWSSGCMAALAVEGLQDFYVAARRLAILA
jgi:hypothetical protein